MSNVLFEASVRLRPDAGGFAAEAQQQIKQQADQIQPGVGATRPDTGIDQFLQRVRTARIEADALMSSLKSGATSFGGAMNEALTLIAEGRKLTQIGEVDFASERLTAAKTLLRDLGDAAPTRVLQDLARAEDQVVQKSIDMNAANRLATQGFDGVGAAGERAGAGLSAFRLGLGAAAFTVAFQGLQRLKEALRTTGDEAFTTGGRLKNALAAAVTGDIVGVFKAIGDEESKLAPPLEKALANLKQMREEASRISLADAVEQSDAFERHIQDVETAARLSGLSIEAAAAFAKHYREELELAASAARDNSRAIGEVEQAIKRAGSAAAAFGEQEGEFGRGVGGVIKSNALETLSGGTGPSGEFQIFSDLPQGIRNAILREQGPGGTEAALIKVLEQAKANREKRLAEVLRVAKKDTNQTTKEKNQVAAAVGAIRADINSFNDQIESLLKADDEPTGRRRSFQLPPRFIERQTVVDATEGLRDNLRLADDILAFLERQKDIAKRGTDRFREVVVAIKAAQAERRSILEDMAQQRQDDAEAAAEALRRALGIREQKLQNALLEAQLKEGDEDDRKALVALRNFYAAQARNMKLAEEERLRFRALELQTRARLRQDEESGGRVDIFAEAVKNFRQFGSNLAEAGGVLSAQDARGQVAALILRAQSTAREIVQSVKLPDTDIGDKRFLNRLRGQRAVDAVAGGADSFGGADSQQAVSNPVVAATNEAEQAQAQRDAQQLAATKEIADEVRRLRLGIRPGKDDPTASVFGPVVTLARNDAAHFPGKS